MDTTQITSEANGRPAHDQEANCPGAVSSLSALLDELARFVRRYVVLTGEQADALALWVAHSYAIEAAETTPYIQITSAEKRSGQSRLLEVLELLVARPLSVVNISKPALFRSIEHDKPTLLLDEYDAIFGSRARGDEELRALLNAGYRRSATVLRCDGPTMQPRRWPVFCPKAMAGIGDLPDTVADRSIPIVLQRKLSGEEAERFLRGDVEPEAEALRERLTKWAILAVPVLKVVRPELPRELDDRAADGWEPVLAIADRAKGEWPVRARKAALTLSASESRVESSPGVELLAAIRQVFDQRQVQSIATHDMIKALAQAEESAYEHWWDAQNDKPATGTPNRLANRLRPFGIQSQDIRFEAGVLKGYRREDFRDSWERHLTAHPSDRPGASE